MLQEHELVEKFKKQGIVSAGHLYLGLPMAVDFVSACAENDLAVIGLEAFVFREGLLTPQLDMIADFSTKERKESWWEYKARCNEQAMSFLQSLPGAANLVINFVIMSQRDWRAN